MSSSELKQEIAVTMGYVGGDGSDWYPEKTDKILALIARERLKAVDELIDKASQVSVSTKYIAENPPSKGKSYMVIGVSMLKKLATNSNKGEAE